jgi:polyhydroxybutyrate depolymerase
MITSRMTLRALVLPTLVLVVAVTGGATPSTPPSTAPGTAACRNLVPGEYSIHVDVDGTTREVLVHVPPVASEPAPRMPLVIAFHGYSAYAWQLAETARLGPMADAGGFVVAYPQGSGTVPSWYVPGGPTPPPAGVDDIRLVEALLDLASAEGCVDAERVVVMGHSMGGAMADAVACALADRIVGVIEVSAVRFAIPCSPTRPVHVVALHALDDPVLPYGGGRIAGAPPSYAQVRPVEQAMADWATRNGCPGGPVTVEEPDGGAVLTWEGCASPVVLHRRPAGGHDYPALASALVREMVLWGSAGEPDPTERCPADVALDSGA